MIDRLPLDLDSLLLPPSPSRPLARPRTRLSPSLPIALWEWGGGASNDGWGMFVGVQTRRRSGVGTGELGVGG
eukprot:758766-Hanusia_phi.AAC.2